MKRSLDISLLLVSSACLLLAVGCSKDDNPAAPTGVAGEYRSTIFIRPAPDDGPDSTHLRGDYMEMSLKEDGTYMSLTHTSYVNKGMTTVDTIVMNGTYVLRADTVRLSDPNNVDAVMMPFARVGNDLHGRLLGIGPHEIYLKRK